MDPDYQVDLLNSRSSTMQPEVYVISFSVHEDLCHSEPDCGGTSLIVTLQPFNVLGSGDKNGAFLFEYT